MSKRIVYNKLVRDLIPDIIAKSGKKSVVHIADDKEYLAHLYKKVHEELNEFIENPSAEEMADLLEVLEHLRDFFNLNENLVQQAKKQKNKERGRFKRKIILDEVSED